VLTRRSALFLWIGDAVVLAVFVLLGMGTHATLDGPSALARFAAFAVPLLAAWTLAAAGLGALQFLPPLRWRVIWGRTLAAWLIAAPLALLARALLLGAATVVVAFALVTLVLGGGFLLLWRSLYVWLAYGRLRPSRP
jgi:hypothetical protein